jgi:hypothetical protein
MKPEEIQVGKVFMDRDGIGCYVIDIGKPTNKKQAWVTWRRPGAFATRTQSDTLRRFSASVVKLDADQRVDPAPDLPNKGMAEIVINEAHDELIKEQT